MSVSWVAVGQMVVGWRVVALLPQDFQVSRRRAGASRTLFRIRHVIHVDMDGRTGQS